MTIKERGRLVLLATVLVTACLLAVARPASGYHDAITEFQEKLRVAGFNLSPIANTSYEVVAPDCTVLGEDASFENYGDYAGDIQKVGGCSSDGWLEVYLTTFLFQNPDTSVFWKVYPYTTIVFWLDLNGDYQADYYVGFVNTTTGVQAVVTDPEFQPICKAYPLWNEDMYLYGVEFHESCIGTPNYFPNLAAVYVHKPGEFIQVLTDYAGWFSGGQPISHDPGSDNTPPSINLLQPSTRIRTSTSITAEWFGYDASGIEKFSVDRKYARWDGGWSAWSLHWSTTKYSAVEAGSYGYSYCYSAIAKDNAGNWSDWSVDRCTTVPMKSDHLHYSSGWARTNRSLAFAGFGYRTTTYGAKAYQSNVRAARVYLLATKCSTCGTVRVYWTSGGVTTHVDVNLYKSTTAYRQPIQVTPTWSTAHTGSITIKVLSHSKVVIVEGLGAYRSSLS